MNDTHPPNSARAISRAWDGQANSYAHGLAQPTGRKCLAAIELAVIRQELAGRGSARILDAGCGPGKHAAALADDGHEVTLVDLSSRMLAKARATVIAAGVGERVTEHQVDLRETGLPDASFDAVIACATVVSDCGDADAALVEFARLLRPGGLAFLSTRNLWVSVDWWGAYCEPHEIEAWIRAGRRLIPQGHQAFDWTFFTPAGLRDACHDAGLTLEHVYPVGMIGAPRDDDGIDAQIPFHLDMVDDPAALARAQELFAVARKAGE